MHIYNALFIDPPRPCVVSALPALRVCVVVGAVELCSRGGVAEKRRRRRRKRIGIYTYPHKIISQAPLQKGGGGCENPKPEKF